MRNSDRCRRDSLFTERPSHARQWASVTYRGPNPAISGRPLVIASLTIGSVKRRRGTRFAVPNLRNPNARLILSIFRHDVTETSRHPCAPRRKEGDQCVALTRNRAHLGDQSIHVRELLSR